MAKKGTTPQGKGSKAKKQGKKRRVKRAPIFVLLGICLATFIGWRALSADSDSPAQADKGYTQPDEKDYSQKGGHSAEPNEPATSTKTGVIDPCTIFDPDNLSEVYETAFAKGKATDKVAYRPQHEQACVYSDGKGKTVTVHSSLNEAKDTDKTVVESLFAKGESEGSSAEETDPAAEGVKTWWIGENRVVLQLNGNVVWMDFSVSDQSAAATLVTTVGSVMRDQLVL